MHAHIPDSLLTRVCAKPGDHLLRPDELDLLRLTIHAAIDDAAMITAKHIVFISGDREPQQGVELRIIMKLQASE